MQREAEQGTYCWFQTQVSYDPEQEFLGAPGIEPVNPAEIHQYCRLQAKEFTHAIALGIG